MDIQQITSQEIKSYAKACLSIYEQIDQLMINGYDLLIVPSRGASPLIEGADICGGQFNSKSDRKLSCGITVRNHIRRCYLPFSADISDNFQINSATIRRFWSRVLSAYVRGKNDDLALKFYNFICNLSSVRNFQPLDCPYDQGGKFIFIDTVISGRAISEIIDSFERYKLDDCHYLLIIDNKGNSLSQKNKDILYKLKSQDRATLIYVDSIFTEDQGPAMSGIWTVTMPQIMEAAMKVIPDFQDDGAVGAGLHYHELRHRDDCSNSKITKSYFLLCLMLQSALNDGDSSLERHRETFIQHIIENKIQEQSTTLEVARPVVENIFPNEVKLTVSSSHIVRANMSETDAKSIINIFLSQVE